jgi:hypothetical protein
MTSLKSPNSWLPLSDKSFDIIAGRGIYPAIASIISPTNCENTRRKVFKHLWLTEFTICCENPLPVGCPFVVSCPSSREPFPFTTLFPYNFFSGSEKLHNQHNSMSRKCVYQNRRYRAFWYGLNKAIHVAVANCTKKYFTLLDSYSIYVNYTFLDSLHKYS